MPQDLARRLDFPFHTDPLDAPLKAPVGGDVAALVALPHAALALDDFVEGTFVHTQLP